MATQLNTLTRESEGYDQLRRRFFNERVPDIHPAEIASPTTTAEVVAAVKRAREHGWKIGVRSGGHLFFCNALLEGGLLIDTRNLNKDIEYDAATKIATVSPGHTVEALTKYLGSAGRFFPAGHSRTVAVGGFLLAGGQGCFQRGWGYTADSWVTQLEVVTSDGEVVIANKTQNADLFWAAPGSGQGYFGVVTRIWIKTIPDRKLFDTTIIVDSTDIFKPLLKWVLATSRKVPKYGVDLFYCTFYADKDDPNGGHESASKRVFFAINETIFADSFDEAKVLASPWDVIPNEFKSYIITTVPLVERTWEELWGFQESFQAQGDGERWNVDSILVEPKVTDGEVSHLSLLPTVWLNFTNCPSSSRPSPRLYTTCLLGCLPVHSVQLTIIPMRQTKPLACHRRLMSRPCAAGRIPSWTQPLTSGFSTHIPRLTVSLAACMLPIST